MKKILLFILGMLLWTLAFPQREFHVFPENHKHTPGTQAGDGSLQNPWDLQTAFNQKPAAVTGGDTLWLHGGIYSGRFISQLNSTETGKYITVSAYKNEKVVLNGNVSSELKAVLQVKGKQVIYKNFEITFLGEFSRNAKDKSFEKVAGINHTNGMNCQFINLQIHDVPGLGFGSWNSTAGTVIESCFIYNNGFIDANGKGGGEGMYIQNSSDTQTRIIKNNTIFNTYYKGIEVWSANRDARREYVKNITLENNVIFNSGLPSGYTVDNIIVGSDDRNGINIARNITLNNNILYHNTDFSKNEVNGNAPSLTLGFTKNAPVENIHVDHNLILGRNNALRLLHVKSVHFSNNTVYSGYIHTQKQTLQHMLDSKSTFKNNLFYTKNAKPILFPKGEKHGIKAIAHPFDSSANNRFEHLKAFDVNPILDVSSTAFAPHAYRVVLFSKKEENVTVTFSKQNLAENLRYVIRDVENLSESVKTGTVPSDKKIVFPMKLNQRKANKTLDNFGVFIIEFHKAEPQKTGFFTKLFGWMF